MTCIFKNEEKNDEKILTKLSFLSVMFFKSSTVRAMTTMNGGCCVYNLS